MSSARGQEIGRRRRVVDVVGEHVEPITRFKAADLRELGAETESAAELTVTTRQRLELDWIVTAHPGRLPEGIPALPDQTALETELQNRLMQAEQASAHKIQQWSTEEPGAYRRLLPGNLLGDALSETLGVDQGCPRCQQHGRMACAPCAGSGHLTCPQCSGQRHCRCDSCRGMGRVPCHTCTGRGQVEESFEEARVDAHGQTVLEHKTRLVPCAACSGGWLACQACASQGELDCTRCGATGHIVCGTCEGRREVDCPDCATTGHRHLLGQVRQQVEIEDLLEPAHADPEVMATVAAHWRDVATLLDDCRLEQVRYTTAPFAVQAQHRLRLPVRQVTLQVAAQQLTFTAYGPSLRIFDYRQAAAALLAQDLVTLERNAQGSGVHLLEAVQRFVESEVNVVIAEHTTSAEVDRRFPGLLSGDYMDRAVRAIDRAVSRLWVQRMWKPTLLCLASIAVLAGILVALSLPHLGLLASAAAALVVGVLAWLAADLVTRQRLRQVFGLPLGERLLRPLKTSASRRRAQRFAVIAGAIVALVAASGTAQLPPVKERSRHASDVAHFDTIVNDWYSRSDRDFALRAYPPTDLLRSAVEQGDLRARVIYAWKLLLGVDNTLVDTRDADRLLHRSFTDSQVAAAARIGQARAALALGNRSSLQSSILGLEALHDPALQPEVNYTLGLIRLTPAMAGVPGSAAQGLASLQQAADAGHASACLELGRRLAAGNGINRDVAAARRYLDKAAGQGLPGARQALADLP